MKIFGIGMGRTGTNTLTKALRTLGYSGVHYPTKKWISEKLPREDFATDVPIWWMYKELDVQYPGSKFILTIRPNLDEWLASSEYKHTEVLGMTGNPHITEYFPDPEPFNARNHTIDYALHHADVLSYFRGRMGDLLVTDFFSGDEWEPLCQFLGKPIPDVPFPHLNRRPNTDIFP